MQIKMHMIISLVLNYSFGGVVGKNFRFKKNRGDKTPLFLYSRN